MSVGKCQACPCVSSGSVQMVLSFHFWPMWPLLSHWDECHEWYSCGQRPKSFFFPYWKRETMRRRMILYESHVSWPSHSPNADVCTWEGGVCTGVPGNKEQNRELSWGTGGCLYSLPCLCLPVLRLQLILNKVLQWLHIELSPQSLTWL